MRSPDHPLTPEAERELAAVEAALAGEPADPQLEELADLAVAVRAERPQVPTAFAAELDELAAAGFRGGEARSGLRSRLPVPRGRLLPALGAAATLILVTAVAIAQSDVLRGPGGDEPAREDSVPETPGAAQDEAADEEPTTPAPETRRGGPSEQPLEEGAEPTTPVPPSPVPGEDFAPRERQRSVERAAELTLATQPDRVSEVADGVVRITDRHRGLVISSSVRGGEDEDAGASFELRIPSDRLRPALADLSELGHVSSRSEEGEDITQPVVSARERIEDANAERKSLLRRLANADDGNEARSIRARLRIVQSQLAGARANLRSLNRRADYSTVQVELESDESGGGNGTLGNAVDDAVGVLEAIAGAALVALAVLVPGLLLAALAWFGGQRLARHRRERALDPSPDPSRKPEPPRGAGSRP